MQDGVAVINNIEKKISSEREIWVRKLPEELVGVIPESVWGSISLEQKKEILRQNGLLDKYTSPRQSISSDHELSSKSPAEVVAPMKNIDAPDESESPIVEEPPSVKKEAQEFANLVETMKDRELRTQNPQEVEIDTTKLSGEERSRVSEETASTANKQTFKLGYQVSDDLVKNSDNLSKNGDISDGKTWAATLLSKIFAIFGE